MIKALFRKQFAELISQFSKKKGGAQNTPKRGLVVFLLIFGILYVSLGFSFFTLAKELLGGLNEKTFPLFYMLVGLIATAIGLLGSVFNAYSTIFDAKDNEMLLSLPIPPRRIVLVRVISLSAMTLLYAGAALLPSAIAFLVYAKTTVLGYINALLMFIPLVLLVEAVTLGIAFIVAAIARKVKNKKTVVLVFSVLITLLFYLVYFRAQNAVTGLTAMGEIPSAFKYALFFYYAMGRASQGSALSMLVVVATGVLAFLLAIFLLSKNFVKFTTSKKNPDAKGKKGVVKSASLRLSLFKREWKMFSSSPAYIMNSAFGVIFLIAIPIFALVKADTLRELAQSLSEVFPHANGVGIAAMLSVFTGGMCCVTAPSVSMEGKRLYVLRSLPIPTGEVFAAKIAVHLAVTVPPMLFLNITLAAILGADVLSWIFMLLLPFASALFVALVGLCLNIDFPVLDWTDEMTAVKSGVGVLIAVFGIMIANVLLMGPYFLLVPFCSDGVYIALLTVLYAGASLVMIHWLKNTGRKKFEKLG